MTNATSSSSNGIQMPDPASVMVLTLAYNGELFHGFARQREGLLTVQSLLEDALTRRFRRPVEVVCAGRTDAGVHARGQVVSFEMQEGEKPSGLLMRSLNGLMKPGVVVTDARRARAGFSARFDAQTREYRYRVVDGPIPPLALEAFAWHVRKELDLDAMRRAAALLAGQHDFESFCLTDSAKGRNTVRTIDSIDIERAVELGEEYIEVRVVGKAFLHSMVRTMVGTLYQVGVGAHEPEWVSDVLAARSRASAGQTAPAKGLTFWHVEYPDDVWL